MLWWLPGVRGGLGCEEVRAWANRRLEEWSQVREVREVSSIPVNNIGPKVMKEFQKVWLI